MFALAAAVVALLALLDVATDAELALRGAAVGTQAAVILSPPEHRWECPNCTATHVTREARPHTPFHPCAGLHGLTAPLIAAGTRAKVEAREREDYIAGDSAQIDGEGRPVMSIVTTRDDGQDVAVLAPCVNVGLESR